MNQNKFYFTQPENAVMFAEDLSQTAKVVYCALLDHMDKKTKRCTLYVASIAAKVHRTVRTVQRSLNQLINKNLIIRTERYGSDGRNLASMFTVLGCAGALAKGYKTHLEKMLPIEELTSIKEMPPAEEMSPMEELPPIEEMVPLEEPIPLEEMLPIEEISPVDERTASVSGMGDNTDALMNYTEYNNNTLKGSKLPPEGGTPVSEELPEPEESPTLKDVPEIMKTTVRYLLMRTGRKNLRQAEIPLIRSLSSIHKPARIQKEIDRACEIFIKKGRRLFTLSFQYIFACLKNQKTFTPWAKSAKKPLPKMKAYDDWLAMYGDVITGGVKAVKATNVTQPSDYDSLIIR